MTDGVVLGASNLQIILAEIENQAARYQWDSVRNICEAALKSQGHVEPHDRIQLTELLAKCLAKASFQAANRKDFLVLMEQARLAYETLTELYESAGNEPLAKLSSARESYSQFWIETDVVERRRRIERSASLSIGSILDTHGKMNESQLIEAYVDLMTFHREAVNLADDWIEASNHLVGALDKGRKAIQTFRDRPPNEQIIQLLHLFLWLQSVQAEPILTSRQFEELGPETRNVCKLLVEASRQIGTAYSLCLADEEAGNVAFDLDGKFEDALAFFSRAESNAQQFNDSLELGIIFAGMAQISYSLALGQEYQEQRRDTLAKGIEYGSKAAKYLEASFHTTYLTSANASLANCLISLATLVETDVSTKKKHLQKAIEVAKTGMTFENHTWAWQLAAHAASKAMFALAGLSDDEEKARLLTNSLQLREENVQTTDKLQPYSWGRGVVRNYLALIEAELARITTLSSRKTSLLEDANRNMQECLRLCEEWIGTGNPGFSYLTAQYSESHGDLLVQIYRLSGEVSKAETGIVAFNNAISFLQTSGKTFAIPLIRWKIGKVQDRLGRFIAASETFATTATDYSNEGTKNPGLKQSLDDFALYMTAWQKIELARQKHREEEFVLAAQRYGEAGEALWRTRTWSFLSEICTARSLLERGEAASVHERHESSAATFDKASEIFKKARTVLADRIERSSATEDKTDLNSWMSIASLEVFCRGRSELERARGLDRKGERKASAEKYNSAAEIFRRLKSSLNDPRDQKELDTLQVFCQALAKMKEAESAMSPEVYREAAAQFAMIGIESGERFHLVALANAAICRALADGTEFRQTRETQLYSSIKNELETAADYYQEAGLTKTGIWTRATQRLFDALAYNARAEIELERDKKTEFFDLAGKHFELAAKLYGEAGFQRKKREALNHLGKVREEREILEYPLQVLREIPLASSTPLATLSPGASQPIGLERLEDADVIGNLSVPVREVSVGSDFLFEVELANVGKGVATLIRLENVVPEGFEIDHQKNPYRLVDHSIDLRGKRMEHLKMQELRLVLKPTHKGLIELKPDIVFADERGTQKRNEIGPVPVTVVELGIGGWLRGPVGKGSKKAESSYQVLQKSGPPPIILPRTTLDALPPESIRFQNERSRTVFVELVNDFLHDYMSRRLYVDVAGWRSLMDLVRKTKIPRSALYGPQGKDGPVLSELEHRGLIDARFFLKERGRGGEIKKVRVAYGNSIVKDIVERAAMQAL